ncbi:Lantibiotic dehydratase domain-containing protein [Kitasatospora cheerisanensis KCTC 2395]|uniref:Lantibiotic dehydratase domain-containing protein n=1 Tax=Kitasatospora cheerisanensis KCTC 2395 TaxID=1348663 RepID=A0A066Z699_9ACTN|nr:Lantibiotic dehydratase domain-containing protein [Kitasatospora cheerisanensis KCTC 2395]
MRAVARPDLAVPVWPELTATGPDHLPTWTRWLRTVWSDEQLAEALGQASAALARQVEALCSAAAPDARDTRRAVLSTARYLLRATARPTPFALFAGVQTTTFALNSQLRWGEQHQALARAGAEWLALVITQLEDCPQLLTRLNVVANSNAAVRGDRLVVPHQPVPRPDGTTGAAEVSVRHTDAVRFAIKAAHTPVRVEDLAAKLGAEFPDTAPARITAALTELVSSRVLITSLHAPATEPDALGHLLAALETADADAVHQVAALVTGLRTVHAELAAHNQAPDTERRRRTAHTMSQLAATKRHPLAVDMRLDADLVLPEAVAREAAHAADLLARLSAFPYGVAAWREYHQRFYERYGRGSLVPLPDMVADSGIGWPDGYPGTAQAAEQPRFSERDAVLSELAQRAALEDHREVELDEALLASLSLGPAEPRLPAHLEIGARLHAGSQQALQRGEFRLEILSVSRAAGVSVGRFLPLLEPEQRTALTSALAGLPTMDVDTVTAQLSYPPLDPATAHVTRTVPTGQLLISLAEHRLPAAGVLFPRDLAVGCDGRRMYLAAPDLGVRIEAAGTNALNLRTHTPPLARLLTELSRAQCAQVTAFSWGAARTLPFLPRLRHGRVILSPATWRLTARELPTADAPWDTWLQALTYWLARRCVPHRVHLVEGDQHLPLYLNHPGHRALLRAHLAQKPVAVLTEAPRPGDTGWAGGRAHEIVVPLTATRPAIWPRLPKPTRARVLARGHGDNPGTSRVLLASLYGNLERQDTILTGHLPDLLQRLDSPPWWFVRFRDPQQHLRLRIALDDPADFGAAAQTVSTWAAELRQAGLLAEVRYPASFPEIGRWGDGPAWDAAEEVFRADSRALLAHLSQPHRPERSALLAAHTVAIACAFSGGMHVGLRWLVANVAAKAPAPIPRPLFAQAVRLADPVDNWAPLRAEPSGAAIVDAWGQRDRALAAYRRHFPGPHTRGVDVDDVLGSLLHVSYVRAHRIDFDDEAHVLYLARAVALARLAKDGAR